MTQLLQGAAGAGYILPYQADPSAARPVCCKIDVEYDVRTAWFENGAYSYANSWWPGPSGFWGDYATDIAVLDPVWYDPPELTSGGQSRFSITGVTRDVYGQALSFCTVKMYRTSDDSLVSVCMSDGNGVFIAQTPYYPDQHYLVAYKVGSPDVEGTTVNNLVAA